MTWREEPPHPSRIFTIVGIIEPVSNDPPDELAQFAPLLGGETLVGENRRMPVLAPDAFRE